MHSPSVNKLYAVENNKTNICSVSNDATRIVNTKSHMPKVFDFLNNQAQWMVL